MKQPVKATIIEHFSSVNDPRIQKKTRHKLIDIIVIAICAVIRGADDWTEIEDYAKAKKGWLKTFHGKVSRIVSKPASRCLSPVGHSETLISRNPEGKCL